VDRKDQKGLWPISPITGEELQVKFLSDSEENALKH
jgi:hypothetical protein